MIKITNLILLVLVLNSCGEFNKVLKSNDYNYKYSKAVEYYQAEQYNRAMPLFNELSTVLRGTAKIQEVNYYFAYCNYSTGDNQMAAYLFKKYTSSYPNGKHAEECAYMHAYCYYLDAPGFSLDDTNTKRAMKELQSFADNFPKSDRINECNSLIDELRSKLSKKAFEIAKQYFITSNFKAAIISLDNVLIDFPSYKNREEVHFFIVKSSYLLAVNSINTKVEERLYSTLDAYIQFKDNYPDSNFLKSLQETYTNTQNSLEKFKKINNEI